MIMMMIGKWVWKLVKVNQKRRAVNDDSFPSVYVLVSLDIFMYVHMS